MNKIYSETIYDHLITQPGDFEDSVSALRTFVAKLTWRASLGRKSHGEIAKMADKKSQDMPEHVRTNCPCAWVIGSDMIAGHHSFPIFHGERCIFMYRYVQYISISHFTSISMVKPPFFPVQPPFFPVKPPFFLGNPFGGFGFPSAKVHAAFGRQLGHGEAQPDAARAAKEIIIWIFNYSI